MTRFYLHFGKENSPMSNLQLIQLFQRKNVDFATYSILSTKQFKLSFPHNDSSIHSFVPIARVNKKQPFLLELGWVRFSRALPLWLAEAY
jgi:hypothetical protein